MPEAGEPFSDQIRQAAKAAMERIGTSELARRCDIDRSNLHNFIAGRIWISEDKLNRLAGELGIRIAKRRS